MEGKIQLGPGQILVEQLPATERIAGLLVEGSMKLPANKARVVAVGPPDEFGTPIWRHGQIIVLPATGAVAFDYNGRLLKVIHHRRIPFGYDEPGA